MSQIKVLITDETGQSSSISGSTSTKATNGATTPNQVIKNQSIAENQQSSESLAYMVMAGQQVLNYTTSNIGKWTGSTRTQTGINNTTQLIGTIGMIATNPVVGVINTAITLGTTGLNTAYEQREDAYAKEYARKRVGEVKGRGR